MSPDNLVPAAQQQQKKHLPGHFGLNQIITGILLVVIVGTAVFLGSVAFLPPDLVEPAYEREMHATTNVAGSESAPVFVGIRERGDSAARWVSRILPKVSDEPTFGMLGFIERGWIQWFGMSPQHWWNHRVRTNADAFVPTMWMRLEIVTFCFLFMSPLFFMCLYLGEARSRIFKRRGMRPGDHKLSVAIAATKIGMVLSWVVAFFPPMIPAVYWIPFAVFFTMAGVVFARSYSIEIT